MHIPRIYIQIPLAIGQQIPLPPVAIHHLHTVLRLKAGNEIIIFNGEGGQYTATITAANKKNMTIAITTFSPINPESSLHIHLGQCLSRHDRMDMAIQKAVELGITVITPILSARSTIKLNARQQATKNQHWQKIIIAACEQSGRTHIPHLQVCSPFNQFINQFPHTQTTTKLICDPQSTRDIKTSLTHAKNHLAVLIGPESGLTDQEYSTAKVYGFQSIHLGPRTLRTETATIAALTAIQLIRGDLTSKNHS